MTSFDYVVIGGGQGGALARMLAEGGKSVALIEKQYVGGSCTNVGCTPTKAHIAAARVAHIVRRSQQFGVESQLDEVNLKSVATRTHRIVEEFRRENEERLMNTAGLELIYGTASFSWNEKIEVQLRENGARQLSADKYVVAVGAKALVPSIKGLSDVPFITNAETFQLEEVPHHLLILGGGYIACEFAQMFARFGSQVTVIQNKPQILPREDEDVAGGLAGVLRNSGVEIVLGEEVELLRRRGNEIEAIWGSETRVFSHVLVATGQEPQTKSLNLHFVSVDVNSSGHITTNDHLKTSNPNIYALGDCRVGPAFTHLAYDDARILRDGLLHNKWRSIKERPVPYTVFTDPQLGRIGLTEKEAKQAGKKFDVVRLPMKETARGVETGQCEGFWKVLIERDTDLILGGAFLSGEGGETMSVVEVAMCANLPYTALRDGIFAHPTWAESLNNLFLRPKNSH